MSIYKPGNRQTCARTCSPVWHGGCRDYAQNDLRHAGLPASLCDFSVTLELYQDMQILQVLSLKGGQDMRQGAHSMAGCRGLALLCS